MITIHLIPIGLNWAIVLMSFEMTFVVNWRNVNITELNFIELNILD